MKELRERMISLKNITFSVILFLLAIQFSAGESGPSCLPGAFSEKEQDSITVHSTVIRKIIDLTNRINSLYLKDDTNSGLALTDSLRRLFDIYDDFRDVDLSMSYYFLGVHSYYNARIIEAQEYLDHALRYLLIYHDWKLEARILRFKGILYTEIYDFYGAEEWYLRRKELVWSQPFAGINDKVESLIYLAIAELNLRKSDEAGRLIQEGFNMIQMYPDSVSDWNMFYLYQTRATFFTERSDHKRAIQDLIKAKDFSGAMPEDNLVSLNLLFGATYFYIGEFAKSQHFYSAAIDASRNNVRLLINSSNNYAIFLGETGNAMKGEKVLSGTLSFLEQSKVANREDYYNLLHYYAEFLRDYTIDIARSVEINLKCYDYLGSEQGKLNMRQDILLSYALGLSQSGHNETALDSINSLLKRYVSGFRSLSCRFDEPDISLLEPNKRIWYMLVARYQILKGYYLEKGDINALVAAAEASGLAAMVMERIKGNIGEEESRIYAGDRYRRVYLDAIVNYSELYTLTGSKKYLDKSFGFSERSKASGLLASTRESRALKNSVPQDIIDMENSITVHMGLCKTRIGVLENGENPDQSLLRYWNDQLLATSERKDSLMKVIERLYPDYSRLKSDTSIIFTSDIPGKTGKRKNFISYVVSDSSLYIYLINSKHTELVRRNTDSTFFNSLVEFRRLISEPDRSSGDALREYKRFRELGFYLYSELIEPVKGYFISDELIISPDHMLSYFPFEILLTSDEGDEKIYYNILPYLMRKFGISYAYSATLLTESAPTRKSIFNRSVSFAPSYAEMILNVDSLLSSRQSSDGYLSDLKFAPEEASYISRLTSGRLFLEDDASETTFKAEVPQYDIIHLAMHTILDARSQSNSRMVFYSKTGSPDDGQLYTYEINALMLNAKMVVLSSCFTGSGLLFSGEGVLSLARGFLFAGSRSVVMSLWEVNDRSGTDIVKSFYRYLKKGNSKSNSLRRSRLEYLRHSDQLQSHPYFWATLVIYGDDNPVYLYPWPASGTIFLIIIVISAGLLFYFRKR